MLLHDAIYTPRAESKVRKKTQSKIEDSIRRSQTLKSENIQVVDLDTLREMEDRPERWKNKINMKPKPSLRIRFISFLKKHANKM